MGLSTRKYNKKECITFKSTSGKYGALSNMSPGYPVTINKVIIRNVELLYQALRYPDYPEIQKRIIGYSSPISAKQYARTHIEKTRSDWNTQRFKIMKFCIELKLHQNKELFSQALLSTFDLPIVEFTSEDKVWGATDEGDYYSGTNALGRLLMELRERVKKNEFKISIPPIPQLIFINVEITTDSIKFTPNNTLPFKSI